MATRRRLFKSFRPQVNFFEDRITPANFYVDNAFTGLTNGTVTTFNAGQANEVLGVVIGTDAFATVEAAVAKAELDAAADTVFLADGNFTINPTANAGAILVSQPLTISGSGQGVSQFLAINNTVDAFGTNSALFTAQNTVLNLNNLTLDGGGAIGKAIGSGVRYESSTGTIGNVTFINCVDDANQTGYGFSAANAGSNVLVQNSSFVLNGRGGLRVRDGAFVRVESSSFFGRSGTTIVNYGVDITNGSDAHITGNTFSGFTAALPDKTSSAAIQIVENSNATILGNTLTNNATGIIIGLGAGDASTANIQFNNITNNDPSLGEGSGVFADTTGTVTALNNFWGTATGPEAPDNPGGTNTSGVSAGVTYKDAGITQPPQGIAIGTLPVQVANTPGGAATGASPNVTITGPAAGVNAPIELKVVFTEAVTGFDASDVVLGGTAGTGTVTNVTTTDNKTFLVTVAGFNVRGNITASVNAGSATNSSGLGNNLGAAVIPFQPIFDRGFATSGDAGIATSVIGVTDTFGTRFNASVFGADFTGGQRVATADVNGDGTLDYIVGSGAGISTQVRVFNGATNTEITTNASILNPFGTSFTRGAYVSGGDLTGDGLAEIIISAERGGGARIRIFSPNAQGVFTQLSDFIGLIGGDDKADTSFRGGARTAVGDMNGDGRNDLIFAAGTGGGPRIALFNGLTLGLNGGPKLRGDFFIFEPSLRNGSYIAAGDVNGDGKAELIGGAGNGASRLRVFDGAALVVGTGNPSSIADYFSFSNSSGGGVRVAADDLDGDGKADVIAGEGPGTGSRVRVYSATNILANGANPTITQELNLFGGFTGGVFVG